MLLLTGDLRAWSEGLAGPQEARPGLDPSTSLTGPASRAPGTRCVHLASDAKLPKQKRPSLAPASRGPPRTRRRRSRGVFLSMD